MQVGQTSLLSLHAIPVPQAGAPFFFEPKNRSGSNEVVLMRPEDLREIWKNLDPRDEDFIAGPITEIWSKQKLAEVIEGATHGPAVRLATGHLHNDGFMDGRHRTKFLLDHGAPLIPVGLSQETAEIIKERGIEVYPVPEHKTGTYEEAILIAFSNSYSPSYVLDMVAQKNPGHAFITPRRIVNDYLTLAQLQIDCLSARQELMRTYISPDFELSRRDQDILTSMEWIKDKMQGWYEENFGSRFSATGAEIGKPASKPIRTKLTPPPYWPAGSAPSFYRAPAHDCA